MNRGKELFRPSVRFYVPKESGKITMNEWSWVDHLNSGLENKCDFPDSNNSNGKFHGKPIYSKLENSVVF